MARRRSAAAHASGKAKAPGTTKSAALQAPPDADPAATQRKLNDLVARRQYSQSLRVREQALRRHPDWSLSPSEAQLWCLEGRQALEQLQPKRAEAAFARALALLEQAFHAGQLAPELAGAYLKLLLLHGQEQTVRTLLREQPQRFQSQQIHWAAGVLALLEGNPAQARRQFERMAAPASPGDTRLCGAPSPCASWEMPRPPRPRFRGPIIPPPRPLPLIWRPPAALTQPPCSPAWAARRRRRSFWRLNCSTACARATTCRPPNSCWPRSARC